MSKEKGRSSAVSLLEDDLDTRCSYHLRRIDEDSFLLLSVRRERRFYFSIQILCRITFTLTLIENFLFERPVLTEAVAGLVRCSRLVVGNLRHRAAG